MKSCSSVPELDEAAVAAVRQWTYEPTLVDGVAVPVLMTVTLNFAAAIALRNCGTTGRAGTPDG